MSAENTETTVPAWKAAEPLAFHHDHDGWMYAKFTGLSFGILLLLVFIAAAMGKKQVPGRLQGAFEFVYEWLREAVMGIMGEKGLPYFPLFISFFLFILFANLLGLFPGMASGTAALNTTLALAIVSIVSLHVIGMKQKGIFGYWGHFFHILDSSKEKGPIKLLMMLLQYLVLPLIELIGEAARPLSLSMRLFGNIYAKEVLLAVLAYMLVDYTTQGLAGQGLFPWLMTVVPLVLRPAILVLGVLVSLIQAVVFTALTMVYFNGALDSHDDHEEHAEHAPEAA